MPVTISISAVPFPQMANAGCGSLFSQFGGPRCGLLLPGAELDAFPLLSTNNIGTVYSRNQELLVTSKLV